MTNKTWAVDFVAFIDGLCPEKWPELNKLDLFRPDIDKCVERVVGDELWTVWLTKLRMTL